MRRWAWRRMACPCMVSKFCMMHRKTMLIMSSRPRGLCHLQGSQVQAGCRVRVKCHCNCLDSVYNTMCCHHYDTTFKYRYRYGSYCAVLLPAAYCSSLGAPGLATWYLHMQNMLAYTKCVEVCANVHVEHLKSPPMELYMYTPSMNRCTRGAWKPLPTYGRYIYL